MRRHGATALLCVVLTGVIALVGYETDWGTGLRLQVILPTDTSRQPAQATLLPMFAMAPLDPTFKEIVERPLFVPTRRPSPGGIAAPVVTMRKGQYRLTGTSVNSSMSMAFLVEKSSGKPLRAAKGAEVGVGSGIKVDSIGPTHVVLRQGGETEELTLTTTSSSQVAAATTANAGTGAPGGTSAVLPPVPPTPSSAPPQNVSAQPAGLTPAAPPLSSATGAAPWVQPPLPIPLPSPGALPPGQAQVAAPVPSAAGSAPSVQEPPADPNSSATRRRRFQNQAPTQ